ncbi:MAG: RtcB family protein [Bacteroidales bacterium]
MIELKGRYNKDCKIYADDIEESAYSLIQNILDSEVSKDVPVRIMPDVHTGKDIVIGFTMPLTNMVNPNHVGVDLGCGLLTGAISPHSFNMLLSTFDGDKTKALAYIDAQIRKYIPMGVSYHQTTKANIDYAHLNKLMHVFHEKWCTRFDDYGCPTINEKYINELIKKVQIKPSTFNLSIGTLGGGEMIAIRIG